MLSGRRKLLLADDSQAVQKIIKVFFGEEGYEVVAVGGGEEALSELGAEPPPDALLADAVMPGPDGYELCERVKRDARLARMPVVLLVGKFEPFNEAEARRVGADTVVTKPFQSIRDLVSKVGSLLGGEARHEERAPQTDSPGSGGRAADESAREEFAQADAAGAHAEADASHAYGSDAPRAFGADTDSPYADLGADDELIEAKHADAFLGDSGAAKVEDLSDDAPTHGRRRGDAGEAQASEEFDAAEFTAAEFTPAEFTPAPFGAREYEHAGTNGHSTAARAASSFHADSADHPEENQMTAHSSFEARAASAAAADDTLLDLGQLEPHAGATASAAEADDFILDLDEDLPQTAHASQGSFGDVLLDEPSAFAEASHGEQAAPFAEQPATFDEQAASFSEPFSESPEHSSESAASFSGSVEHVSFSDSVEHVAESAAPFEASAASSSETAAAESSHGFMQDGPQGFASYVAPEGSASAPRGFVEPEVVPADVPVPAVVEGEFTDGSVEGDLPRPPAAAEAPQAVAPHAVAAQGEPSAAGHSVVEGHTRVEEPVRADQLSREAIDAIARRVVGLMSDKVVREIAWEVVPELAELLIRQKLEEEGKK